MAEQLSPTFYRDKADQNAPIAYAMLEEGDEHIAMIPSFVAQLGPELEKITGLTFAHVPDNEVQKALNITFDEFYELSVTAYRSEPKPYSKRECAHFMRTNATDESLKRFADFWWSEVESKGELTKEDLRLNGYKDIADSLAF